jgi:enoyl-CoA hydratase
MAYENIQLEVEEGIAVLTIHRPKVLNSLNRATLLELDQVLGELGRRDDVGVVILTGAGDKAFVAGADIKEMSVMGAEAGRQWAHLGQRVLRHIERLGKPIIAAVNGFALGGGCEMAMAATVRVAASNAAFGQPEVNLGLIPGFAGTQRLARLVGKGRALELILTGDRIGAEEAHRIGLVNRVVAPERLLEECRQMARAILAKAPLAVRYALEAVHHGVEAGFEEGSRLEASLFGLTFASEDMREGTQAFLEKRAPRFQGK